MKGSSRISKLPHRHPPISRRVSAVLAFICWAGFGVIAYLVLNGATGAFDRWGLLSYRMADSLAFGGPERVFEAVRDATALGGIFLRNLFVLGAIAALLFLRLRREALLFFLTVTSGWLVSGLLKLLVGRERPEIVPHLMAAGGGSFPSGHSFGAAVVYIGMALAFSSLSGRQTVRITVVASSVVVSMMVAWSRVLLGVHYPTDVIAGWLGGAGWALASVALFSRAVHHR
ncbi:phosphatase PAP2 family protein [Erythrobacter litoralis]|nr:phosphatase PAP2 family protein [Erythrobacter litoralis]